MRATKCLISLLLLLLCGVLASQDAAAEWSGKTLLDLRVRQEVLDGVYHFAPQTDRDWIRVRSRAGYAVQNGHHRFETRLVNEHRHYLTPDQKFDGDELIVDRLAWTWTPCDCGATKWTVGRQDIIWPGGFLMLEGHPLDGSRSIYHNAIRLQMKRRDDRFDIAAIYNPMTDDFVLAGDEDRRLNNGDELGLAARWMKGPWQWSAILKQSDRSEFHLGDLRTVTLGGRYAGPLLEWGKLEAELALQYQHRGTRSVLPDGSGGSQAPDGLAHAAQLFLTRELPGSTSLTTGGFLYSGRTSSAGAFQVPWGAWPKWSELYIYTLIAESSPGLVHVAAWENIAAARCELNRPLGRLGGRRFDARLGLSWLQAPEPRWSSRGWLTQAELKVDLNAGFTGHLLWETLHPGEFHDGSQGLPVLDDPVHFLRWQITYALK